jgi:ATP adenylyltransferase/5',5'''-P-1,P-4-tetraphosphate phosphorylase II
MILNNSRFENIFVLLRLFYFVTNDYNKGLIRAIAIFQATLFLSFYVATTLFYHSHQVDGITIYHSHPYSGSSEDHKHAQNDLLLIDLISTVAYLIQFVLVGVGLIPIKSYSQNLKPIGISSSDSFQFSFYLRAPPIST